MSKARGVFVFASGFRSDLFFRLAAVMPYCDCCFRRKNGDLCSDSKRRKDLFKNPSGPQEIRLCQNPKLRLTL
jgi:hypothetical protein